MTEITEIPVSNDPTLYLRRSGLRHPTYNKLHSSFTEGKNKEHKRPLPSVLKVTNESK